MPVMIEWKNSNKSVILKNLDIELIVKNSIAKILGIKLPILYYYMYIIGIKKDLPAQKWDFSVEKIKRNKNWNEKNSPWMNSIDYRLETRYYSL